MSKSLELCERLHNRWLHLSGCASGNALRREYGEIESLQKHVFSSGESFDSKIFPQFAILADSQMETCAKPIAANRGPVLRRYCDSTLVGCRIGKNEAYDFINLNFFFVSLFNYLFQI